MTEIFLPVTLPPLSLPGYSSMATNRLLCLSQYTGSDYPVGRTITVTQLPLIVVEEDLRGLFSQILGINHKVERVDRSISPSLPPRHKKSQDCLVELPDRLRAPSSIAQVVFLNGTSIQRLFKLANKKGSLKPQLLVLNKSDFSTFSELGINERGM